MLKICKKNAMENEIILNQKETSMHIIWRFIDSRRTYYIKWIVLTMDI